MENLNNQELLNAEANLEAVETTEAAGVDEVKYYSESGEEISKSAFIREKFLNDNMSRKAISEEFGIPYRTVYGATVNMTNGAEPVGRGRSAANPIINVTADGKVVLEETQADGTVKYFINGEEVETIEGMELSQVNRNEFVVSQVEAGVSRADLAKWLGLSYGVIYGLTKDAEGQGTAKYMVELEDGTSMPRTEYIRKRVAEGAKKGDIAKELNVPYSVIWQATKTVKSVDEKLHDAIAAVAKFADKVTDPQAFKDAIALLEEAAVIAEATTEEVAEDTAEV